MGFDMHASGGDGGRYKSPTQSKIFQMGIGIALAVFLFQADRTISTFGAVGALPHAVVSKDTIVAGIRLVGLECDRLVVEVNRVVRVTSDGATPCHIMTIFK